MSPPPDPAGTAAVELVDRYLRLCQDRRLDDAAELLAPGAVLDFPGGVRHADLEALVADAAGRYRSVAKTRQLAAAGWDDRGRRIVVHQGELHGVNRHGAAFSGVRYVDVFVLDGERIAEQHVWNDLAVGDALTRRPTEVTGA